MGLELNMAFDRPTLTELRALVAQDIASAVPGADPLLRYSNLNILGAALAGLAHLQYAYLDYISRQAVPYTAQDEYLEAWAAFKNLARELPTSASGTVTFSGTNGTLLPSGSSITRADGKTFTTTSDGTVSSGVVTVAAQADPDPNGETGAWGNMDVGTALTLGTSVAGINSTGSVATAFTGGSDLESDDSLRERMLNAFQNPSHGGSAADYVTWAREVAGVTRAWCPTSTMGPGTVQVYVMLDEAQAAHDGFPQGTNGVASDETRDTPATGDQLAVANYIFAKQPVTALVYAVAPTAYTVNFNIGGLSSASAAVKAAVIAAIAAIFASKGELGGTVNLSDIEAAIASVSGTSGFLIVSPAANITAGAGQIHVLGTVTFS